MSNSDVCIVKLNDMLSIFMKGTNYKPENVKLSDMCCCDVEGDVLCFMAFTSGHII